MILVRASCAAEKSARLRDMEHFELYTHGWFRVLGYPQPLIMTESLRGSPRRRYFPDAGRLCTAAYLTKTRGIKSGVPLIRITVFGGLYWSPLFWETTICPINPGSKVNPRGLNRQSTTLLNFWGLVGNKGIESLSYPPLFLLTPVSKLRCHCKN